MGWAGHVRSTARTDTSSGRAQRRPRTAAARPGRRSFAFPAQAARTAPDGARNGARDHPTDARNTPNLLRNVANATLRVHPITPGSKTLSGSQVVTSKRTSFMCFAPGHTHGDSCHHHW